MSQTVSSRAHQFFFSSLFSFSFYSVAQGWRVKEGESRKDSQGGDNELLGLKDFYFIYLFTTTKETETQCVMKKNYEIVTHCQRRGEGDWTPWKSIFHSVTHTSLYMLEVARAMSSVIRDWSSPASLYVMCRRRLIWRRVFIVSPCLEEVNHAERLKGVLQPWSCV